MTQQELKIIITTSRNPSPSLLRFVKQLGRIIPFSRIINRGNKFLKSLVYTCIIEKATDLLMIYENRGNPNSLIVSHLPSGPTVFFRLSNIISIYSKKNPKLPENFPFIVIDNLTSPLGKRLSVIFRNLFPIPNKNSKKIITLSGQGDFISFRHHWFERKGDKISEIVLTELFPSFDMYPYKISLGLLGDKISEIEWSINSFKNTSKKRPIF
nr:U3 snoRNP protein, IMP4 [Cryptomonas sp.]